MPQDKLENPGSGEAPQGSQELSIFFNNGPSYSVREGYYQGKKHLIVPVVMMIEGVHKGSHGSLLHLAEDLGRYPHSWNGIPVTINHPSIEGKNVSANDPRVLDQFKAGRIFNTSWEDGKLKAEAWLDEVLLKKMSPEVLSYIKNMNPLDVSVGVFTDEESKSGVWNKETYVAIARNHRPDHLALLPGGKGACSWEDGCGIRINQAGTHLELESITLNLGDQKMGQISPCCLAKVEKILENKKLGFKTEEDKKWLLTLEETVIDKILPKEDGPESIQINKDQVSEYLHKTAKTIADYLAFMPSELQAEVNTALKLSGDHKKEVITNIMTNSKDVWKQEDLEKMDIEVLEKISKSAKPVVNYAPLGGNGSSGAGGIAPLKMIVPNKKK